MGDRYLRSPGRHACLTGPRKRSENPRSGSNCKCMFSVAWARPFSEAQAVQMDRVYDFGSSSCRFKHCRVQIQ